MYDLNTTLTFFFNFCRIMSVLNVPQLLIFDSFFFLQETLLLLAYYNQVLTI